MDTLASIVLQTSRFFKFKQFCLLDFKLNSIIASVREKKNPTVLKIIIRPKDRRASWACCNLAYLAVPFGEVTLAAALVSAAGLLGEN